MDGVVVEKPFFRVLSCNNYALDIVRVHAACVYIYTNESLFSVLNTSTSTPSTACANVILLALINALTREDVI